MRNARTTSSHRRSHRLREGALAHAKRPRCQHARSGCKIAVARRYASPAPLAHAFHQAKRQGNGIQRAPRSPFCRVNAILQPLRACWSLCRGVTTSHNRDFAAIPHAPAPPPWTSCRVTEILQPLLARWGRLRTHQHRRRGRRVAQPQNRSRPSFATSEVTQTHASCKTLASTEQFSKLFRNRAILDATPQSDGPRSCSTIKRPSTLLHNRTTLDAARVNRAVLDTARTFLLPCKSRQRVE